MKKGFTLAEVLITLGIIGIVAAMTLPALINKHQKKQTAVKLVYSLNILNTAFRAAVADYGDMKNWDFIVESPDNDNARKAFVDKYLIPYVKNAKPSPEAGYTYAGLGYSEAYPPRQPNGTITGFTSKVYYPIAVLSGMYFYSGRISGDGEKAVTFYVDLNGKEKPNIFGRDIFVFILIPDKNIVRTVGYQYKNPKSYCTAGNAWACAAVIEQNNWKIPDDYVW